MMKVKPPSVRVLLAALLGLLLVPAATSAGTTHAVPTGDTLAVAMTAYNAVPDQTDGNPLVTSIGVYSDPEVVAARSADLGSELPYGTVIEVDAASSSPSCGYGIVGNEIGLRVIADAMNAKMKDKIDILLPQQAKMPSGKTANPAIMLGICNKVTIKVVGHIDTSNMPQSQTELAADLDGAKDLAVAK